MKTRFPKIFPWPGAKWWMEDVLHRFLPREFRSLHLPFVGRADILAILRAIGHENHAHLSDLNPRVVAAHLGIRDATEEVIRFLLEHQARHSPAYFESIRDRYSSDLPTALRASDFLYCMLGAHRGIYKESVGGVCSTTSPGRPISVNVAAIRRHALTLRSTSITAEDFAPAALRAGEGDLVILDAPFLNALGYGGISFNEADQMRVAHVCRLLDRRGVLFVAMNNPHPYIAHLFRGFNVETVVAPRTLGRAKNGGRAEEFVITNF